MRIAIIGGGGYVGLVTGLGFAELGNQVVCVDVDESKVTQLCAGKSPIYEQGIENMLRRNLEAGRVSFHTKIGSAVSESDVVFVAVGTPSASDGNADLSQVIGAAEAVAHHLNGYKVIVIKSTVPVGTVELVRGILRRGFTEGEDFDVVSNPEFLREGRGLYDFMYPNRIVIGSLSQRASQVMKDLYAPLVDGNALWDEAPPPADREIPVPIVDTDLASA
ncbi:MAG: nucleotide sugar dehydrogenase, partial [Dehalococcoidia bacterium]